MDIIGRARALPFWLRLAILGALVVTFIASHLLLYTVIGEGIQAVFFVMFLVAGVFFGPLGVLASWAVSIAADLALDFGAGIGPNGIADVVSGVLGFIVALGFAWLFRLQDELRTKDQRLRESEQRLRLLSDLTLEGVAIHVDGRVVEANEAFVRLTQRPRDEIIGFPAMDLASSLVSPELAAMGPQKATDAAFELSAVLKNGGKVQVEIITKPISFRGKPAVVSLVRDIGERKRAEEKLRRAERLASLGTLVAGVAHELNNPLMYIRGNIELIESTAAGVAKGRPIDESAAAKIVRQSGTAMEGIDRLARLAKSLKQVARPSTGPRAPAPPTLLVQSVIEAARGRLPSTVALTQDLRATANVEANAAEVEQMLLNLVVNAADAVAARGSLIAVRTRDEPEFVLFEVEDDGPGIPSDVRSSVFTPFFTTKAEGTGLGLSISHAIAREHGGDLTFTTSEWGTTFALRLPRSHVLSRNAIP